MSTGEAAAERRIAEIVDAAPAEIKDRARRLGEAMVRQGRIARAEIAPPPVLSRDRIIGGDKAQMGSFLHCACVGGDKWKCSGALIAPRLVVTAAHCRTSATQVMVGGNKLHYPDEAGARTIPVAQAIVHPGYVKYPVNDCDIMLLVLAEPAYNPAAGLATAAEIFAAAAFHIVGFGYDDPGNPASFGIKRRATLDLQAIMERPGIDVAALAETLGFHPDYEFVAGRKHLGIDSCNGDSGGPIYVMVDGAYRLAGLTSRSTRTAEVGCGDGGIYVQPRKFLDWINQNAAAAGLPPVL